MVREVILDLETTGFQRRNDDVVGSHRIIEIGCVEVINNKITGNEFHAYVNPHRDVDVKATRVHGLTRSFLKDKPSFEEISNDLLNFIRDSHIVIHNAPFDTAFLNSEFKRLKKEEQPNGVFLVTDTLDLARKAFPGERNDLNSLMKRYNIQTPRDKHGALIDAQILAMLYTKHIS
jgi:DNA polymerase-3 subunit epsilon